LKHKTLPVYDLIVQSWWMETLIYSDHFFDLTASVRFDCTDQEMAMAFRQLRMIRDSFRACDYPPSAAAARQHLLNGMTQTLLGFREFLSGNEAAAHFILRSAEAELELLDAALDRLATPLWQTGQRIL
jgi:hypothetical protein